MHSLILTPILIFGLAISVLTLSACKDKEIKATPSYCEQNPGTCESVMDGKKYFAFKVGSWWVYEEQNSGIRDSMYVTNFTTDTTNYNFNVTIYSSQQDYKYYYYPQYITNAKCGLNNPGSTERCLYIHREKGRPGDFVGAGICFYVSLVKGSSIYVPNTAFDNNQIFIEDILQSYSIGSFLFAKTIKVHELNTFIEGRQATNHFYTKGIGLIRKELLDSNEVWNLVNYHIEE